MALVIQKSPLPERVSWEEFDNTFDWNQGEHCALIAPNGWGKSTLLRALSWRRDWVLVLCTKKRDSTYDDFMREGYERVKKFPVNSLTALPKPKEKKSQRILLWPDYKVMADLYKAGPMFKKLLEFVYIDENWCLCLDDLYYLSTVLKLSKEIAAINYQVRSMGVTLVSAMQRPKKVPLETWDQSTHAFVGGIGNYDDIAMIRALAKVDTRTLQVWLSHLRKQEWLYIPTRIHADPVYVKPPLRRVD